MDFMKGIMGTSTMGGHLMAKENKIQKLEDALVQQMLTAATKAIHALRSFRVFSLKMLNKFEIGMNY